MWMLTAHLASQWICNTEVAIASYIIIQASLIDVLVRLTIMLANALLPPVETHTDQESVVLAPSPMSATYIYISDYIIQWNYM